MATAFDAAMDFTLPAEGRFVDDPDDAGGPTMEGITQAVYDRYRLSIGEINQSVELMTDSERDAIYSQQYWIPAHCNEMPVQLAVCHFDWAVNHGVTGAIETLQKILQVTADGNFGPKTRSAMLSADVDTIVSNYLDARRAWYKQRVIDVPSQQKFLNGWLKRVDDLESYIATLT